VRFVDVVVVVLVKPLVVVVSVLEVAPPTEIGVVQLNRPGITQVGLKS
jgi:hypothetical protein